MSAPAGIGRTQRRILLAAELHRRKHGQSPTWRELRDLLGLDRGGLRGRLYSLRRQGLVEFTIEARSLRVTPAGIRAALNGERKR